MSDGKRFKEIRLLLGMKQADVATMLGINQGFVSQYEHDKLVNADALEAIQKFIQALKRVVNTTTR